MALMDTLGALTPYRDQSGIKTHVPFWDPLTVHIGSDPATCVKCMNYRNRPTQPVTIKGIGGAPTRATTIPEDGAARKRFPIGSGVLDYFPDALVAVAEVSWQGNEQHNPGQPLHWARGKSTDEADALIRHFLQRGLRDSDGLRHSAKMAWRALALLQKEIESDQDPKPTPA